MHRTVYVQGNHMLQIATMPNNSIQLCQMIQIRAIELKMVPHADCARGCGRPLRKMAHAAE